MQPLRRSCGSSLLEVCDEAEACREAISARIERNNEDCFKNSFVAPLCAKDAAEAVGLRPSLTSHWYCRRVLLQIAGTGKGTDTTHEVQRQLVS